MKVGNTFTRKVYSSNVVIKNNEGGDIPYIVNEYFLMILPDTP